MMMIVTKRMMGMIMIAITDDSNDSNDDNKEKYKHDDSVSEPAP